MLMNVGVIDWIMENLPVATHLRKITPPPPSVINCQQLLSWGRTPCIPSTHTVQCSWAPSGAGTHGCCEFSSVIPHHMQKSVSQGSSSSSSSYSLHPVFPQCSLSSGVKRLIQTTNLGLSPQKSLVPSILTSYKFLHQAKRSFSDQARGQHWSMVINTNIQKAVCSFSKLTIAASSMTALKGF